MIDRPADIVEHGRQSLDYTAGMTVSTFKLDNHTRDAVERCLERVCEAARRLGDRARDLLPNQPWNDIRGMGNRLRHGYDRIDHTVIWHVVRDELPSLITEVDDVLQRLTVAEPGT